MIQGGSHMLIDSYMKRFETGDYF